MATYCYFSTPPNVNPMPTCTCAVVKILKTSFGVDRLTHKQGLFEYTLSPDWSH